MIAEEIESDGALGKERKLPSSYRLVIYECPSCRRTSVPTSEGPVEIPQARAAELCDGAEVLDLSESAAGRGSAAGRNGGAGAKVEHPSGDNGSNGTGDGNGFPVSVGEYLYQALDERAVFVAVLDAAGVRLVRLRLEPFVLVGATTDESLLPRPLHSRFLVRERLEFYSREELEEIALAGGRRLGVEVTREGAKTLAAGARGTPRNLQGLLFRARDLAQAEKGATAAIDGATAGRALKSQGVDPRGLSRLDRRILETLLSRERPLGLRTLADLLGEDQKTLAEIYEPYLLRQGYLVRTCELMRKTGAERPRPRRASCLSEGPAPLEG